MRHIDYGLGVLRRVGAGARARGGPPVRPRRPATARWSREGPLAGYEVQRRFYEIGSPAGLAETRRTCWQRRLRLHVLREPYLAEAAAVIARLDAGGDRAAGRAARRRCASAAGRLFVLGVGGSAANASHAVNDFRKICGIEAYTPTDNVSELTARVNDEGWETVLRRLAAGQPARAARRGARLLGRRRRPRAATSAPTWCAPLELAQAGRRADRAAIVGPRRRLHRAGGRRLRDRADRQPGDASRRTPRRSRPWSGTCWCRIPRCRRRPRSGSRPASEPTRRCSSTATAS